MADNPQSPRQRSESQYTSPDDFSREFPQVEAHVWTRLGVFDQDAQFLPGSRIFWSALRTGFDNNHAWAIHQGGRDVKPGTFTAARATWRRDLDLPNFETIHARLRHPRPYVPTVECQRLEFDADAVSKALRAISETTLRPPRMESPRFLATDGWSWGVRLGASPNVLELGWHIHPLTQWGELAERLRELLVSLDLEMAGTIEKHWAAPAEQNAGPRFYGADSPFGPLP